MASLLMTRCLLLVYLFRNILCTPTADCRMESFPVQANFKEDRYQGKWYEVSWILQPWLKPEWNYHDFIHNYTKTDYGLSVYAQGRWPENATMCATAVIQRLYSTEESAKYIYEYEVDNRKTNASHWVVDTDYDNYALVVGCREVAPNGTCVGREGWLWTRCPKPPMSNVTYMWDRLQDFCLSKNDFFPTYNNRECRADIPDSCSSADSGAMAPTTAGMSVLIISITAAVMTVLSSHP